MRAGPFLPIGLISCALCGCSLRQEPNPNDPNLVNATRQPYVLKDYMQQLSAVIQNAEIDRQINQAQGADLMVKGAQDYMAKVKIKDVPKNELWMVSEAYIAAHEWEPAKRYLSDAMPADTSPDRIVNDTLRYARCCAEMGQVEEAISYTRKAFSAPSDWKWPILYAVYLEIVPAADRTEPAKRMELAQLTIDAIHQHEAATGTASDPTRRDWIVLRPFHINKAWELVEKLYTEAGKPDLAALAKKHQAPGDTKTPLTKA